MKTSHQRPVQVIRVMVSGYGEEQETLSFAGMERDKAKAMQRPRVRLLPRLASLLLQYSELIGYYLLKLIGKCRVPFGILDVIVEPLYAIQIEE